MKPYEKALQHFEVKAKKIIYKYNVLPSLEYNSSSYTRLSSFFGKFNISLIQLDEELQKESKGIINRYKNSDKCDITTLLDELNERRQQAKMEFICCSQPG